MACWRQSLRGTKLLQLLLIFVGIGRLLHRGTGKQFCTTIVNGFNDQALRRTQWKDIEDIHNHVQGTWEIMGDFNCILNANKRIGSAATMREMREF